MDAFAVCVSAVQFWCPGRQLGGQGEEHAEGEGHTEGEGQREEEEGQSDRRMCDWQGDSSVGAPFPGGRAA